uniref:UV radiation resistance-associated gene protein n=1 Tax=Steinernema glaseri TaxID=37863 RepID=A0A1I8AQP7_9BILA
MRTFRTDNVSVPISISRIGFHSGSPLGLADCSPFAYSPPGILTRTSTSTGVIKRAKERCPICTASTRLMCPKCVTSRVKYSSSYSVYKHAAERNELLHERFSREVDEELDSEVTMVRDRILELKSKAERLQESIEEKRRNVDLLRKKLSKGQHVCIGLEEGMRVVTKSLSERVAIPRRVVDGRRRLLLAKRKKMAGQLLVWIFPIIKIRGSEFESIKETRENSWQLINSDDPYDMVSSTAAEQDFLYSISGCVVNEKFCFEWLHRSLTPRDALVPDRTNCHVFAGLCFLAQLVHLLLLLFAIPPPVDLNPNELLTRPTFTKSILANFLFNLKVAIVAVCASQQVPFEKIDLSRPLRNLERLYEKICDDMGKRALPQEIPMSLPDSLKKEINELKETLTSNDSVDVLVLEDWVAL